MFNFNNQQIMKNNQKTRKKNLRKLTKLFSSFRNANKDIVYSDILMLKVKGNGIEYEKITRKNFVIKTKTITYNNETYKLNTSFIDNLLFQIKLISKHYDKLFIEFFIKLGEIKNGNYIIYFDSNEDNFKLMLNE